MTYRLIDEVRTRHELPDRLVPLWREEERKSWRRRFMVLIPLAALLVLCFVLCRFMG
jgi:hypothetical protein